MIPFVGPSHPLPLDRLDLQRSINLYPVRAEQGGEKAESNLRPTSGLSVWSSGSGSLGAFLSINDDSGEAGDGDTFTLTVTRAGDTSGTSVVRWTATGDTYNGAEGFKRDDDLYTGLLTFAPGETIKTLNFTLEVVASLAFDATVTLSEPSVGTLITDGVGTLSAESEAVALTWDSEFTDDPDSHVVYSAGDTVATRTSNPLASVRSPGSVQTVSPQPLKLYVEFIIRNLGPSDPGTPAVGLANGVATGLSGFGVNACHYGQSGLVRTEGADTASYAALQVDDVIGMAFDCATNKVWFARNGAWNGNPAAGTGQAGTLTAPALFRVSGCLYDAGESIEIAQALTYAPPSGFVSMLVPP